MKICLSLLICLFTTLTYAQTTRTLFNSEILYGNIKQISETQNSVKIIPGKPGKLMMPITDTTFFDKNGYTIERHSNADSLTIYKYQTIFDKKGIRKETTTVTGKKLTLKYDKKGNLSECYEVSKSGIIYCSERFKHDANGNLTEIVFYSPDHEMYLKKVYTYNNNLPVEEDNYTSKNILSYQMYYIYNEFDEKGNWIERNMSGKFTNGMPAITLITNRIITYYK